MKRNVLFILVMVFSLLNIVNAQGTLPLVNPGDKTPYEKFLDWYYTKWLPDYQAAEKALWEGYCQAWNENMQKGISRLNKDPQQIGVTPVNGALLLNQTDLSVPGRKGSFPVVLFYNSKIWDGNTLKPNSHLGHGWDQHYGKIFEPVAGDSGLNYETPTGLRIFFKKSGNNRFLATNGSFMEITNDTLLKTGNGTVMIFNNHVDRTVKKVIDPDGNITSFFYNGGGELDSIITSSREKLTFFNDWCLDSIIYTGNGNTRQKIEYHWEYPFADSSPFQYLSSGEQLTLLKSVVYPNGDSIVYHYNYYGELTGIDNPQGGKIFYTYKSDTFYIPIKVVYPPIAETTSTEAHYTRGIRKIKSYDPWTAPDTAVTTYDRIFLTNGSSNRAVSNADSIIVTHPAGNKSIFRYMASYDSLVGKATTASWHWQNGLLKNRVALDKNDIFLTKSTPYIKTITKDSIWVLGQTTDSTPVKTYRTCYYNYDTLGNARLIAIKGDLSINDDNRWIYHEFETNSDRYVIHHLKSEYVRADSGSNPNLNRTNYFYDESGSIVEWYRDAHDTVAQWDSIPGYRGKLTKVTCWKGNSDSTISEIRYDKLGNTVMAIRHPSAGTAETTFTYFDPTDDQNKYDYAYPWRTVSHLSNSACSLTTRNEYDKHSGLIIRTFDPNADSVVYQHDNMNRLINVWQPNETEKTQKIHYIKYQTSPLKPSAVVDSVELQNNQWLISAAFYDGFSNLIQEKQLDFTNGSEKSIIRNIAYDALGRPDSVALPYEISSASFDYTTPSWSDITTYKYDGVTKYSIKFPTGDSVRSSRYAHIDTIFDEKGNKTVYKKNAMGAVDTLIDARGNKTIYTYNRLGFLTKVKDAENKETYYYYDTLGRLRGVNNPDARSQWTYAGDSVDVYYEYDNLNNLTTKKDAQGTTYYTYDELIRLTEVEFYNGDETVDKVKLSYDEAVSPPSPYSEFNNPKGRLCMLVTSGIDSTLFYYNDVGNLTRKKVAINGLDGVKIFTYKYNIAGQCTLFYGAGNVNYHYDNFGRLKEIPDILTSIKYNPAGLSVRNNYDNSTRDTIAYDSRLRPKKIKVFDPEESILVSLTYAYEKNSNVDSIIDSVVTDNRQKFAYDSLNRLTNVYCPGGDQSFTYDKVGNRLTKSGTEYTYVSGTNRLDNINGGWSYRYDNSGNMVRRSNYWGTVDTFIYNWHNRLTQFTRFTENVEFAYNISGLRVKKHYYTTGGGGGEGGDMGTGFGDPVNDMGLKSQGADSVYNKGRDISKVWLKNTANNYEFTIINKKLFDVQNKVKFFITLDIDTVVNSGRITLPEDTLTIVPKKAAWEYCLFIGDNEYGYYTQNGTKHSNPMGMLVNKVFGDSGKITLKISKQLLNNVPAIRYTLSTFAPGLTNSDSLWQGGSSAADVWPGSKKTFGGEINGYGQITPNSVTLNGEYTIYYIYDGIDPVVEYLADGSILCRYIYANGKHVAEIAGADTTWSYCDALGSTRKMADETGYAVWSSTYYPFGEMTGDGGNEHSFTGKEFDTELGLNYFCQRYYDPEIGRFMEMDPILNPATSSYAYCSNNPLVYIDPLGLTGVPNEINEGDVFEYNDGGYTVSVGPFVYYWELESIGTLNIPDYSNWVLPYYHYSNNSTGYNPNSYMGGSSGNRPSGWFLRVHAPTKNQIRTEALINNYKSSQPDALSIQINSNVEGIWVLSPDIMERISSSTAIDITSDSELRTAYNVDYTSMYFSLIPEAIISVAGAASVPYLGVVLGPAAAFVQLKLLRESGRTAGEAAKNRLRKKKMNIK